MDRSVAAGILAIILLTSCGIPDNVVDDRRIRSGNSPGEVIHEVRTDAYGWEKVSPSAYRECKKGRVFHLSTRTCSN